MTKSSKSKVHGSDMDLSGDKTYQGYWTVPGPIKDVPPDRPKPVKKKREEGIRLTPQQQQRIKSKKSYLV